MGHLQRCVFSSPGVALSRSQLTPFSPSLQNSFSPLATSSGLSPKFDRNGEFSNSYELDSSEILIPFSSFHRLWEFGSSYFDPTNTRAFPDCEARRIFERIAAGKYKGGKDAQLGYSGGKAKSSRKEGKKDKKKKY